MMSAGFASSVCAAGVAVVSDVSEATCAFAKRPEVRAVSATKIFRNIVMILIVI